jgi:hypothetical protein
MKIIIPQGEFSIKDVSHVTELLLALKDHAEICIWGHRDTSLNVLLNKTSALLIYFRFSGDHGFTSIDLVRDKNIKEDFLLNNGQVDEYPLNLLRTRQEGMEAIIYYFENAHMTPEIDWISEAKSTI